MYHRRVHYIDKVQDQRDTVHAYVYMNILVLRQIILLLEESY